MIAYAPGKVLIAGAYSVLEGAPAIVSAVDRGVLAYEEESPLGNHGTRSSKDCREIVAARELGILATFPRFDASALRTEGADGAGTRKLGLGSSAAITAACLLAARPDLDLDREALERLAFAAHKRAQPRGSGVDVLAAVHGGLLAVRSGPFGPRPLPYAPPEGVCFAVFAAPTSASSHDMVGAVQALRRERPSTYGRAIALAGRAAEDAVAASDARALCAGLVEERTALSALGVAAGVSIVDPRLEATTRAVADAGGFLGPAGAGGGDILLYAGDEPPAPGLIDALKGVGYDAVPLALGGPGAHLSSESAIGSSDRIPRAS